MKLDNNNQSFLSLIKAGLWEKEVRLLRYDKIDFFSVYQLSEEQSVEGIIAAGIEHVVDTKVPKEDVLQFVGQALQLEQRNTAMNCFIAEIVDKMRKAGIYTLLIKGQGIAQCYNRPLWRACGDVDLFLSDDNYEKAREFLTPLASSVEKENDYTKHQGLVIDPWSVEIHGTLRGELTSRIDRVLDEIKGDVFYGGNVRAWQNGPTQVFLMSANNDVVYVFSHILQHFFKGGIGLRQVCDWCRLLWKNREDIDIKLLERHLREMALMSEWHAFASLAVDWLGMPKEAMPFYSDSSKWRRKSQRILSFIIETGNFGHNRDDSYLQNYTGLKRKVMQFNRITRDTITHFLIFPLDSLKVWWGRMMIGLRVLVKG